MRVGFEIFKILYRLYYSRSYFVCYHNNVTTVLELHFSRLLSNKAYFKVFLSAKNLVAIFHVNPYYWVLLAYLMIHVTINEKIIIQQNNYEK